MLQLASKICHRQWSVFNALRKPRPHSGAACAPLAGKPKVAAGIDGDFVEAAKEQDSLRREMQELHCGWELCAVSLLEGGLLVSWSRADGERFDRRRATACELHRQMVSGFPPVGPSELLVRIVGCHKWSLRYAGACALHVDAMVKS